MVAQNPMIHGVLWNSKIRSFRCTYIFCTNYDWLFAAISRKDKKWAIFNILMTTNPEVNITRQVTPFLSPTLWPLSIAIFHSLGEICKCIWKIVFSYFRERHGSLDSGLPLARCSRLKIQNIFLLTQQLFWYFYTQSIATFHFCILRIAPHPLCITLWSVKFTFNLKSFFYRKVAKHLVHNMFCFQFDTNLAPILWPQSAIPKLL